MSRRQFSIVVVGRLNPAIHHPLWYKSLGLITEPEAVAANPAVLLTPEFARFDTAGFEVLCLANRWQIKTSNMDLARRIGDVANAVFDRLTDTPLTSIGLNYDWWTSVPCLDVSRAIGELVSGLPLGLAAADEEKSTRLVQITTKYGLPDVEPTSQLRVERDLKIQILSDSAPNSLHVVIGAEHRLRSTVMHHFAFSTVLNSILHVRDHAERRFGQILDAANRLEVR